MSVLGALVPNGRPLVVVSVFLGAISYAPRSWEDLRELDISRYLAPTFHLGPGTFRQTFSDFR